MRFRTFVVVICSCTGSHNITQKSIDEICLILYFFEMDEFSETYNNGLRKVLGFFLQ